MKVVLLAGGLGTRMREETQFRPKPMVTIGGEPLLWHIMRIFANHGFCDFVICGGYKQEVIEDYFSGKFWQKQASALAQAFPPVGEPETNWHISIVDTGPLTPTGGRLKKIQSQTGGERFFAGYGDSLADVNVSKLLDRHRRGGRPSTVTLAHPTSRFGVADVDEDGLVRSFAEKPVLRELVSIGFFVFEPEVFSLLNEQSVLEEAPLSALASAGNLMSFEHNGYWQAVDTYRELVQVQNIWDRGEASWRLS